MRRRDLALAALLLPSVALAFARGTVRVDVRDATGAPTTARVELKAADGRTQATVRVGEVYVADGVVPGEYDVIVEPEGGMPWQGPRHVSVLERRVAGVVAIVGEPAASKKHKATPGVLRGEEPACDGARDARLIHSELIQALAFARGALAAGRLDVYRTAGKGKGRGKLLCSAAIAGGSVDLSLPVGDYWVSAEFVGGGSATAYYRLSPGKAAPPLALRWK